MKSIAVKLIISVLFMCGNSNSIIAQSSMSLDGNSYSVSLTKLNGSITRPSWKIDTFIFDSGEMHPAGMQKREGFGDAPYNTNVIYKLCQ